MPRKSPLSLPKTPSQLESMVREAESPHRIIEERPVVCELHEGGCVCRGETASLGGVMPTTTIQLDAFYESGGLPVVPMMQSAQHWLRFDGARIRVLDRSRLGKIFSADRSVRRIRISMGKMI